MIPGGAKGLLKPWHLFINDFALWHRNQARNSHRSTELFLNKCLPAEPLCSAQGDRTDIILRCLYSWRGGLGLDSRSLRSCPTR